jgi:hypothetical protein
LDFQEPVLIFAGDAPKESINGALHYNIIFSIFATGNKMSSKEKLEKRFLSLPRDFTFDELVRLFAQYGYELSRKGRSSGSRVAFVRGNEVFTMHRPHPENIVKRGTLQNVKEYLKQKNDI